MGIESITHRNDGAPVKIPHSPEEWLQWVSAGRTRNWMLDDPLLDWLTLYGDSRDYIPKHDFDGYNKNLDFLEFIFDRGREFETGILRLFQEEYEVTAIAQDVSEIRSLEKARATFEALKSGVPIIYQAVLWDAQNMTYGSPDFLIRSDVLHQMFPLSFSAVDAEATASDLKDATWHYVVVDTKFTTLHLNASGSEVANQDSTPAYKAQLYIYNRMLGRLQGFEPPKSYLLGRGWERKQGQETYRGSSALELLGPVSQKGTVANQIPIADEVEKALDWVRRVRTKGEDWQLLPEPTVPELHPNMSNADDAGMMREISAPELEPGFGEVSSAVKWMGVKKWLAVELKELTLLWQVGPRGRRSAHSEGICRWDDPSITPKTVGVTGAKRVPVLERILEVNTDNGQPVRPTHVSAHRQEWHPEPRVEFYVDFESCSDLNDDFSNLPHKGGQPLIFMIGCGHLEDGEWHFKSFVVHHLTEQEELRIIQEWVAHMNEVRDRLDPACEDPRLIHWSHAEPGFLENNYSSARARHGEDANWPELAWYDFLNRVMLEEPVVIDGALSFGLKAVANAMHANNLIDTNWGDSQVDGLGAMVGAWRCDEEAKAMSVSMPEIPLMVDIVHYNEIDCKVMMELLRYLRAHN